MFKTERERRKRKERRTKTASSMLTDHILPQRKS